MDLETLEDGALLARYREGGDEHAFAELVRRHLNLVYGAASRLVGGDRASAEDIAQSVFVELSARAARLENHPSLSGWLYTTTRHLAGHSRRERMRREKREQITMSLNTDSGPNPQEWEQLRPVLDEAMARLPEADRLAVLLRYFEDQDLKAVGRALGLSDNAARMRVQRALEKLRSHLQRQGVTATTAALAALLTANAAKAAPVGLAAQITTAAATTAATSLSLASTSTISLGSITMKTSVVYGVSAILVAVPLLYQEFQIGAARAELARLARTEQEPKSGFGPDEQARQLLAQAELEQLRKDAAELEQLRSEIDSMQSSRTPEQMGRFAAAIQSLQSAEAEHQAASQEKEFRELHVKVVNSLKHIGLAARIYATDRKGEFPTNFMQITNIIGSEIPGGQPMDKFEFYPQPRAVNESEPMLILFHEKEPRQRQDGQWEKAYGMADGSVQTAVSPTRDFSRWERDNGGIAEPLPAK